MKYELANYEVFPKMVLNGAETEITIRALGSHVYFAPDYDYRLEVMPMEETREATGYDYDRPKLTVTRDAIKFTYRFTGEQEYQLRLYDDAPGAKVSDKNLRIFCLNEDLFRLRPYKGDTHVHSCHSDGNGSVEFVIANYRKAGFDFTTITDHEQYYPSKLAIDAYRDLPVDISIFSGEEVHSPDNHVHIVNFGGNASVNELANENEALYRQEVEEIRRERDLPDNADGFEIAASIWVFNKIREFGGLAIYAHPYWRARTWHVKTKMSDYFFENRCFDAFELLGGHTVLENNMQLEYYNQKREEGIVVPFVGASDSHEQEKPEAYWFDWLSTIALAPDKEFESLKNAILDFKSMAVESYKGEGVRVHSSFRLAKYGIFLIEEYFPVHDLLCRAEGELMKQYFAYHDESALEALKALQGRTARYMKKCFGEI